MYGTGRVEERGKYPAVVHEPHERHHPAARRSWRRASRAWSRARGFPHQRVPRDEATARARRRAATRDRPGVPTSESSRPSASRRRSESDIDIARPAVAKGGPRNRANIRTRSFLAIKRSYARTSRSSTSSLNVAPGGISPSPTSAYPMSAGTTMFLLPPTRMPLSASGTYTTGGGLGAPSPVNSPPPPRRPSRASWVPPRWLRA